jgi:ParB family transcriptional regulator, chromosome partitioning protein
VSTEKYLTYRGDVRAAVGVGGTVAFTTVHAEGQPTALYRLDAETLALATDPLPRGGVALVADGEALWIAGSDGHVYQGAARGGAPKLKGPALATSPTALALLADERLAVLAGSEILILNRKDGKTLQTLELPEPGSCLAADPTGRWLVAGTARGVVSVFEGEGKPEFALSESDRLHEGAVTALLFEPDELRFLSAGADQKLLSTLARGKLEPEDKGRGNNHSDLVTALIWGPGDRLYSGSRDGTIKNWPRAGAVKPSTVKDGVGRIVALTLVQVHTKAHLVAACDDNTLRFFPLDPVGKVGEWSHKVHDAPAWARNELAQDDFRRREAALKTLAGYRDIPAIELIAEQVGKDPDHALRLQATKLLSDSGHPRAAKLLEKGVGHGDEAVRVASFEGLRKHLGADDLRPLDLALKADKADVGRLAVRALAPLAARDDQALARLVAALDAKTWEVRQEALAVLEKVHDAHSPEASLTALQSKYSDLRRLALVRLYQRKLLGDASVRSALRRAAEDADPEVRRTAFLLSLHTREPLLRALRERDPDLQRQLSELEGAEAEDQGGKPGLVENVLGAVGAAMKAVKDRAASATLGEADYEPLLQAMASRALDTCLRGARGLASLGDPRAFGLLLQLSREEDKWARVAVCRALAALDDPRALNRLRSMLYDPEAEVRDAAFTALAQIHQADPLLAAESGLNATFEDVRRRGLQALIQQIRKAPPKGAGEPSWQLLVRALNDSFPSVRSEAFKAALNLQIAGGGPNTLRFVLKSIHPDVRLEVLTEAMAQEKEPWVWDLVLEFFNDPDPTLRGEAFEFAAKKTKGLEFLEAGLGSRYADLRRKSVDALIKKHTPAAQAMLARALDDEEREVRLAALESLIDADARPALERALASPRDDVRLRAARSLAQHGDPAALAPLRALATRPEPPERERQKDWLDLVESALAGLAELADPATLTDVIPLLDSPHPAIRAQAARTLMWVARPGALDPLRQALQHADPQVKYRAAIGLAYCGDASIAPLIFSDAAKPSLSPEARLAAALALGATGEDQLVAFLDDDATRDRALLLLLMLEWKAPRGTASRCLAALSARAPRARLEAAEALECVADPAAFRAFVVRRMNDRGDDPAWKIPEAAVESFAELLVHGAPQTRARTARLLATLAEKEQAAWDLAWSAHQARFAGEIADLHEQARTRRPVPLEQTPEQIRELAFGAYVGLVREQGGSAAGRGQRGGADPHIVRVRQTALGRIMSLARAHPHFARAARPVFVQVLGDPNQPVRTQAFEQLQALGMEGAALAAEALAAGHTDLGVKGLELLTGGASEAEAQAVLDRVMMERTDDLATEAGKLLIARRDPVSVAGRALAAAHEPLRSQAVAWLAAEYDKGGDAPKLLRKALESRYQKVREAAALELATKEDAAAFDALVKVLEAAQQPGPQRRAIQALTTLGDPRAPDAFLDRIDHDPSGTAQADDLLRAAGSFRRPETAERMLALLEKDRKYREAAFGAVLVVSGYDQRIDDPEDERPDRRWEEKQHPRRDAILARLMDRLLALGDAKLLARLIAPARWARGREVGAPLAMLAAHPEERLRQGAVEALGWRLRKRGGEAEPLAKALSHRDPITQFLAAEGLARAGRAEGLSVLLASVEFVSDLRLRRRAVLALGELGDERALDTLLRLANEDGHALQESAAEAIGHLGRSSKGGEIFALLERFAKGQGGVAENALKGLRWLDTVAGWQLIRKKAADESFGHRETAVELLGYHDDPATRDLLLRLIAEDEDSSVSEAALTSARRLWGPDALEPDYALLQNRDQDDVEDSIKRVCERGDPRRIFEIYPKCPDEVRQELAISILNRSPLPLAEARAAMASPDARTAQLAAHVLGRAGAQAADAGEAIGSAIDRWRAAWDEQRRKAGRGEGDERLAPLTHALRSLAWAAGRLGAVRDRLLALAVAHADDPEFQPVRLEAVLALAAMEPKPDVVAALKSAASGDDPEARAVAAQALGRLHKDPEPALAGQLLSDRVSFNRLARQEGIRLVEPLRQAAGQLHYQGVAVPFLVERGEVDRLAAVAADRKLPEATRLGAIEGLAALGREAAEDVLRKLGQAGEEDEELRKAAWRALRRSKRNRQKAAAGVKP